MQGANVHVKKLVSIANVLIFARHHWACRSLPELNPPVPCVACLNVIMLKQMTLIFHPHTTPLTLGEKVRYDILADLIFAAPLFNGCPAKGTLAH